MKFMTKIANALMERYLPDPYIFVAILTVLVLFLGIILTPSTPLDMIVYWGEGFWGLLNFTMQMVIVLAAGHVLANSPVFKRFLSFSARKINKPSSAIIIVTFVSIVASWINWGFGLVIGALFAKEIARHVKKVDYRLLIASAYSGFIVWHGGLAGSIPLSIATPGHPYEDMIGGIIPTTQTIFTPYNLFIVIVIALTLPFFNRWMMPKQEDVVEVDPELLLEEEQKFPPAEKTFASWTERSFVLTVLIGLIGV
ncbi:short-chain fatty acid transporter, partial [Butyricicoccus sp. 1XD8-22]